IGMTALFARSGYEIITHTGPGYLDSLAGLIFFLLIGRWFQSYTFTRLNFERDYQDYFPIAAHRINDSGETEPVASEDLAPGDRILVRPGQLIPADGVLTNSPTAGIDYSFVTGEADPRRAQKGQEVFAGGRATTASLNICISKTTSHSYLLQLWQREGTSNKKYDVAPPESLVRYFTVFVILLALATFAWWYPTDIQLAFHAATAVLIIACPCALALAAPFAYGTLQRLFGQVGYYLRGPGVIHHLSKVDAFVFDKTGTLIDQEADDELVELSDAQHSRGLGPVFLAMAEQSDHPRARSFARALRQKGTQPIALANVEEVVGEGLQANYHGQTYKVGKAAFCGLSPDALGTFACEGNQPIFALEAANTRLRQGGSNLAKAGLRTVPFVARVTDRIFARSTRECVDHGA
ncbi:MAG: HAD-IC family P-type ATPase, partial [Bacteroidota bacterium]